MDHNFFAYSSLYVSIDDFKYEFRSIYSSEFWSESFWEKKVTEVSIKEKADHLPKENYDSNFSKNLIDKYNVKYILEDIELLFDENEDNKDKLFFISLNDNRYKIFSNQDYSVWFMD